ncbi:MAG: type II toxin-antitoxin system VapC family toxin [Ignavibacteria bacterium]|nr:type II toxin-antitoxin system VapC family toxin [Ignavibacteria bacterium]
MKNVYCETTIISYQTSRPNRDVLLTAQQQITYQWWEEYRPYVRIFISQSVVNEISSGDVNAAARRLTLIDGIPLLDMDNSILLLAQKLVDSGHIPVKVQEDAIHIAIASVHGMDYILSWNCKHIVNPAIQRKLEPIISKAGYRMPVICTPFEFIEGEYHVER